ncbi:MerR family transcriptional regulator [Castellaniella defragrans]|uniref:MerR family transcriptional regulator n=1 Tax=Castellaniella defragrans TaxID=75697 RepID=UPI0009FC819B|nr:MerR family transcriptional regulator [Castellaniella defragrans]KAB0612358.1 MerR family transcriptional regulator [Castellaniella defragrans]
MNISRAAKLAGVNVETIRYYQRRGLVAVPAKPIGSHRRYSLDVVERIRFIKRAQAWGFSLDEISLLLQPAREVQCAQVQELVQEKIQTLHSQMRDLGRMVAGLESLLEQCRGQPGCAQCPLRGDALCLAPGAA